MGKKVKSKFWCHSPSVLFGFSLIDIFPTKNQGFHLLLYSLPQSGVMMKRSVFAATFATVNNAETLKGPPVKNYLTSIRFNQKLSSYLRRNLCS